MQDLLSSVWMYLTKVTFFLSFFLQKLLIISYGLTEVFMLIIQKIWSSSHCCLLLCCPVMSNSVMPWTAACQASLSLIISQSLPKFMSIALVMPPSHFILWCPLLLLPSVFSSSRDFSNESAVLIRWSKYWSFSINISPSNKYSGLMSLRIDWFDLLAVQGTFRSLLQHHISKASILWRSAFFMVQLSQLYVTTGKTIALTIQTFVGRVSLHFDTEMYWKFCLVLSLLSFQEVIIFWFHGCSHHLQWF